MTNTSRRSCHWPKDVGDNFLVGREMFRQHVVDVAKQRNIVRNRNRVHLEAAHLVPLHRLYLLAESSALDFLGLKHVGQGKHVDASLQKLVSVAIGSPLASFRFLMSAYLAFSMIMPWHVYASMQPHL